MGIRFDSVTVRYGDNTVLDSLDLTVEPGEVMALLGPSGSGKTTALRNDGGKPGTFALPYAAGLVKDAPHTANAKRFLDFLLSKQVQQEVSSIGGGFSARTDVDATDKNAEALKQIMSGVQVFQPDWTQVNGQLNSYVSAWQAATGG